MSQVSIFTPQVQICIPSKHRLMKTKMAQADLGLTGGQFTCVGWESESKFLSPMMQCQHGVRTNPFIHYQYNNYYQLYMWPFFDVDLPHYIPWTFSRTLGTIWC